MSSKIYPSKSTGLDDFRGCGEVSGRQTRTERGGCGGTPVGIPYAAVDTHCKVLLPYFSSDQAQQVHKTEQRENCQHIRDDSIHRAVKNDAEDATLWSINFQELGKKMGKRMTKRERTVTVGGQHAAE